MPDISVHTAQYIDKKIKERFIEKLPQYCEGVDKWEIHWSPTQAFERPEDLFWLDFFFNPYEPSQKELGTGGRNRFEGFTQINICVPLNSDIVTDEDPIGTSPAFICSADIERAFKRGDIFNGIQIVKFQEYTSALQVYDDFCFLPVRIFWRADLPN